MTKSKNAPSLATLFAQANGAIDPLTGGVVPPLQSATTFVRDEDYQLTSPNHSYARDQNDLVRLAEDMLTIAEHGEDGLLYPTGMAAVVALLQTVPNGGCIIMQSGIYWGVTKWTRAFCALRNIDLIEVDCADLDALQNVARPADILWIETPSNPYLKTVDIAECARIAKANGAKLAVDSTASTPALAQPMDFGADFVMHSATKGINGHSDVLAGYLGCADKSSNRWSLIKEERHGAGVVIGSFEAWLLIRGMRTMPLRVERMSSNALQVAEHLLAHPAIDAVYYPGLVSDPGHELASKQMSGGYGCLVSALVKDSREDALRVAGKLKLFKRATSLGGVESLVEHRHTIENTVPDNLLRLSVGIEAASDLIADLDAALT